MFVNGVYINIFNFKAIKLNKRHTINKKVTIVKYINIIKIKQKTKFKDKFFFVYKQKLAAKISTRKLMIIP